MTVTFEPDADWLVYLANPRKPDYVLPPGAVDAHCHVFGPGRRLPLRARAEVHAGATPRKEKLFALRDFLGFDRNVIVQATCHGADNRALVDALLASDDRARGVATIKPGVTRAELADMHEAGVRGVRFNFVRRLADPKPDEYYRGLVDLIKEFGWHIVIYFEARRPGRTLGPVHVTADGHRGRPHGQARRDPAARRRGLRPVPEADAGARERVGQAERRRTAVGRPVRRDYDDFVPFARHIAETFPDRVIWGTDWPHPNMKSHMPDEGDLVDLIPRIAPTEELQRKLLVDNPMRLYWPRRVGLMTSYTADFDDIPGTRVFTAQRAKSGYELNQFCMSLMKEANRERFKANERAYLDETTR